MGRTGHLERKWLHVKQFIDDTFNTLKAHSHPDPHSHTLAHSRRQPSPPEPTLPSGEYMLYPTKPDHETASKDELERRSPPITTTSPSLRTLLTYEDHDHTRKLGSKYLLLNLWRNGGDPPNTSLSTPESPYSPVPVIIPLFYLLNPLFQQFKRLPNRSHFHPFTDLVVISFPRTPIGAPFAPPSMHYTQRREASYVCLSNCLHPSRTLF